MPRDTRDRDEKLTCFAAHLEAEQLDRYCRDYPSASRIDAYEACRVTIKEGKRYARVDVGTSGKYMVDGDGTIYGIKGYGKVHKGHTYGTLDTIEDWDWSGYTATRKVTS